MDLATRNLHKRLLEMCDCYLETDHRAVLKQMEQAPSADPEEDGLKYLAVAILHTVSEKAGKFSLKNKGAVLEAKIKNGEKEILPAPAPAVAAQIFDIMSRILHQEGQKTEMALELGLRNSTLEVTVKLKREEGMESLKIIFPPL